MINPRSAFLRTFALTTALAAASSADTTFVLQPSDLDENRDVPGRFQFRRTSSSWGIGPLLHVYGPHSFDTGECPDMSGIGWGEPSHGFVGRSGDSVISVVKTDGGAEISFRAPARGRYEVRWTAKDLSSCCFHGYECTIGIYTVPPVEMHWINDRGETSGEYVLEDAPRGLLVFRGGSFTGEGGNRGDVLRWDVEIRFTPRRPGDFNDDGRVDAVDLGLMLEAWGPVSQGHVADLDGNHRVDASDLGTLFSRWTG